MNDGTRLPPLTAYLVIRIMLALAWLGASVSGVVSNLDLSGPALILSLITAAPVFVAALAYPYVGPKQSLVLDATAVLYAGYMLHIFASVDLSKDALASLVFLFYPLYALIIMTAELVVFSSWKRFRSRAFDGQNSPG